jgi:hypothetical protein
MEDENIDTEFMQRKLIEGERTKSELVESDLIESLL